jgi:murein DD-endopeptidase MepM/ murein hydrolase activator NlpD
MLPEHESQEPSEHAAGRIILRIVGHLLAGLRWLIVHGWRVLGAIVRWLSADPLRARIALVVAPIIGILIGAFVVRFFQYNVIPSERNATFASWWTGDQAERAQLVTVQRTVCPNAPFILPADGYIGLLYGDPRLPYNDLRRHQGIDIFSLGGPGETPVYAAYDGYISRYEGWVSALIERVPDDPLYPGRQIWLYYTHMASADGSEDFIDDSFPEGMQEFFVEQGTLLGYTGQYGGALGPVGVHLHFSIVLDDGFGSFTNELYFDNTVDPSAYLGMAVNYACAPEVPSCTANSTCSEAVLGAGGG